MPIQYSIAGYSNIYFTECNSNNVSRSVYNTTEKHCANICIYPLSIFILAIKILSLTKSCLFINFLYEQPYRNYICYRSHYGITDANVDTKSTTTTNTITTNNATTTSDNTTTITTTTTTAGAFFGRRTILVYV